MLLRVAMNNIRKAWLTLIGVGIASITVNIDFTIVNTSLANIQRDLHASVIDLQWVMAGFGILFSTFLVTMGRLGDLYGHRKLLYVGMVIFAIASLGSGIAQSIHFLIVMRMLQGFSSAIIFPTAMAIAANAFPKELQGRALGIYGSFMGIGLAFGPVFGSIIVGLLNWRWIFFVNIPIILTSLAICLPILQESKEKITPAIDWLGAFLITIALATLIFAINQGPMYGWHSAVIISCFAAAIIFTLLFIMVERRLDNPLIRFRLFLNRGFLAGVAVCCILVMLAWPVLFVMPLYLHIALGFSTTLVGVLIFTITIMTVIAPPVSGYYYDRKGPNVLIHAIFALAIISLLMFSQFGPHSPLFFIIPAFIIFGAAWGIGMGMFIPLSLSEISDPQDSGVATGVLLTVANVMAVISLTINTTLFNYGKSISFTHGIRLVSIFLIALCIVLWVTTSIIRHTAAKKPITKN